MDVLADAVAAMRSGQPRAVLTDVRAPWGLRYPAITGASFHVVLQGACWLLPAGPEAGERIGLGPGDVVFLRNGGDHALADDPRTPLTDFRPRRAAGSPVGQVHVDGPGPRSLLLCGAYQLIPTRRHPLLSDLPDVMLIPGRPGAHQALHSTVQLLGGELDGSLPGRDGIVPALVDAMLLYIVRAWLDEQSVKPANDCETGSWAAALTDPGVSRALESIHADPAHAWTVERLGARGAMSRSVFAQRFTGMVGVPPLAYLTWWRMTLAGRLVRESDAPLAFIAARVGYGSEFAFSKAFKREFGVAPGRYRRQAVPPGVAWSELSVEPPLR